MVRPWEIPPRQDLTGKEPYRTRWGAEPSRGHQKSSDTSVSELFCIRTRTGIAGQGPEPPRYQPLRRPKYPLGIVTGQKSRETSDVRCAMAVGPADPVAYWSGRGRFPPDRTSQGRNPTERGGERSLPGVTRKVPTHSCWNFSDEAMENPSVMTPDLQSTLRFCVGCFRIFNKVLQKLWIIL